MRIDRLASAQLAACAAAGILAAALSGCGQENRFALYHPIPSSTRSAYFSKLWLRRHKPVSPL
jgi:hypothetical protein